MPDCSKFCDNFVRITPPPPPPPPPGRILVPGGQWFQYSDTKEKVYMAFQADPENWIFRPVRARDKILSNCIRFGGNALCLYSIMTHGGDAKHENRTDMNPFIGFDPYNPVNPQIMREWLGIAAEMDNAGKTLIFNFRDDETRPWGKNKMMVKAEKDYIAFIIDTFKHLTHLVWMVAEEYDEIMSPAYARQVARFIKDRDNHPVVIHQRNGTSFDFADAKYKGKSLFDSFFMQCVKIESRTDLRGRVRRAVKQARGRYNVCMFEGTNTDGLRWGHGAEAMAWAQIVADEGAYFGWYDRGTNKYSGKELRFLETLRKQMEKKING